MGNSLEVQKEEILNRYGNAQIEFEQFTGTTIERPLFNNIINKLDKNSTLVVTRLDRLARNTIEGIQVVQKLFDKGVAVHVLNVGLLENTSMGKFFLTTLLEVSEMEKNTILERTLSGKMIAKTKAGFKEGRPREFTQTQIDMALNLLGEFSYTQVEKMTKISKSTLTRAQRKRKDEALLMLG